MFLSLMSNYFSDTHTFIFFPYLPLDLPCPCILVDPVTPPLIVSELPIIVVFVRKLIQPVAMLLVFLPLPVVDLSVGPPEYTIALNAIIMPLTDITTAIFRLQGAPTIYFVVFDIAIKSGFFTFYLATPVTFVEQVFRNMFLTTR